MVKPSNLYAGIEPDVKISTLTKEDFHAELEKGYADMKNGCMKDVRQVFVDIRKDYNL